MKKIMLTFSFFLFMMATVLAQQAPRVDQRQENQKQRIKQGVTSGELTRRETAHAARDQRHIRRAERRAKADGTVTPHESARLHRKQNKASRQLHRNKNDRQERPSAN
ncbi:MAG: hypothetical protein JNM57_09160 [Cyclobacteriaceae bacterium]|nr:hypothetical protein [Cyclobacteriaceae bacterium]